jgi:leucyl-tRNA synthetase
VSVEQLSRTRGPAFVIADCALAPADGHLSQLRGLAIADVCARFLRARGRAVLFSVGFSAFGMQAEQQAQSSGQAVSAWAERTHERVKRDLEVLGLSCDWERTRSACDPDVYRCTQWLFLTLLELGVIYRDGGRWLMRIGEYASTHERKLELLGGWDAAAIDAQRDLVDRIEGVEILARTFDGEELVVFTPHAQAVARARFVAASPSFPQVERWTTDAAIAEQVAALRGASHENVDAAVPFVVTEALAIVPGVAGILPIVVTPLVDTRYGATAVLGMPELDEADRAIAAHLPEPAGMAWKTSSASESARPSSRARVHDLPVSRPAAWGAPLPVLDCPSCGMLPVPREELPVLLPEDPQGAHADEARPHRDAQCPSCGGAARRETDTIDPRLDEMWIWLAACTPKQGGNGPMIDGSVCAGWLPAERLITTRRLAGRVYERRAIAQILQDVGVLPTLPNGEPFAGALLHEPVSSPEPTITGELDELDRVFTCMGGDTVRLALLYGASHGRVLRWSEQPLRTCQGFLGRLREYAQPRLREWALAGRDAPSEPESEASVKLRGRLAHWCAVAREKVTEELERAEMQRAVHNVVRLLTRIQDFESRQLERDELDARDREAIVAALLTLVRLLAPLAPHVAEELWAAAGNATLISEASWPSSAGEADEMPRPSLSPQPTRSTG